MKHIIVGTGAITQTVVNNSDNLLLWDKISNKMIDEEFADILSLVLGWKIIQRKEWNDGVLIANPDINRTIIDMDKELIRYIRDKKLNGIIAKTAIVEFPYVDPAELYDILEDIEIEDDKKIMISQPGFIGPYIKYGDGVDHKLIKMLSQINNIKIENLPIKNDILIISPFYLNGDESKFIADPKWRMNRYSEITKILHLYELQNHH